MAEEYDYLFKSIVVGDGGVGKTALTLRFSKGFFTEDYKMTIGVDFHVKTIEIDAEEGQIRAKLQIWDTGGQERFSSIRPMYYRGSLGALALFDLTNAASFEHLPQWIEEIRANVKTEIPLLLVGNKSDLVEQRAVSLEEINNFTSNFNLYYMETSAKTGEGVGDCFYILACLMIGSGVPNQLISDGIVYNPGQIPITTTEISSPQLEPEFDYAAPPVPEPSPEESYESSHIFEPEPEFDYVAPPVPEPSPGEVYESTPTYEPEYEPEIPIPEPQIEEPDEQPAEFIFKTPEEILSNEISEEERLNTIVKPKIEEAYKPKAVPFTSNVPVPAPAPNGFQSPQEIKPIESIPTKTAPFLIPQDRSESQADVLKELSHEPLYSKKSKKKIEKQKKKEEKEKKLQEEKEKKLQEEKEKKLQAEKEKKLQEEKEKQEKLIEEMKKTKKEKKEKPKKVKKEKADQIVSETTIPTQEISGAKTSSPNSLFQTLSQKTEEPEKKSIASFVPFSEGKESEAPESSKLRIIPNVTDTESAHSSFTPIQSTPLIQSESPKPAGNETTTCKKCGSVLSNDYVFCNKCGDRL